MKRLALYLSTITLLGLLTACNHKAEVPQLSSRNDTLSWAMGENIGLSLQEMGGALNLDNELVMKALRHTLDKGDQPIDDNTFREAMNYILYIQQTEMMRRDNQNEAKVNEMQEAYFAQLVKEHPGVKKHESGFYYEEVKAGTGRKAIFGDRISFDYRSFLMFSGEPYDQTYGKRKPITHVVGRPMFQGLIDGMQLMNAGSIYRFYFPYQLAFGSQGSGDIPGYTPFIYEVELHEIYKD
ncbi:MAG: FKBP-type peptidyl-prolyl cis-trans isomerase [Bacteroidales bacterium]|nr:FKBP-type peptidyl-prolyl cis-trans isomerase [Bacteroidales bacterium]